MDHYKKDRTLIRHTTTLALLVICVVLTLMSYWKLEGLEAMVNNLQSVLSMQITNQGNEISAIKGSLQEEVREALKSQDTLLTSGGSRVLLEGGKLMAEAWFSPRSIAAGETAHIAFYVDGQQHKVHAKSADGARYTAQLELPLCKQVDAVALLDSADGLRQEAIETVYTEDLLNFFATTEVNGQEFIFTIRKLPDGVDITAARILVDGASPISLQKQGGEGATEPTYTANPFAEGPREGSHTLTLEADTAAGITFHTQDAITVSFAGADNMSVEVLGELYFTPVW